MNTEQNPMYEWNTLPWRTIERSVFKLQKRIYQASQRNDSVLVHQLQRLLITSWSAKCLAVRRVTQDNQGKKTAGIDGMKALSPKLRMHLVQTLRVDLKTRPVRRVWIPKPNAPTEKRGLGIPTLFNRAAQMSRIVMVFDQDVPVTMRLTPSISASTRNPSMCWMPISKNVSIASVIPPCWQSFRHFHSYEESSKDGSKRE